MVLVAERLEGGPVSSRVSTFPDVFSVAKGIYALLFAWLFIWLPVRQRVTFKAAALAWKYLVFRAVD